MIKDKMKSLIEKKMGGNNKKAIENLVVFLILLIITIISINIIWGKDKKEKEDIKESEYTVLANTIKDSNISEGNEYNLQQELEDILSKIEGVGKVKVLVTYTESSEVVAIYNENKNVSITEEADTTGGTRTIESTDSSKEIVMDGENKPITEKIIMPKVEGAIVIAEGGGNINIKSNIVQAVSAVTGVSTHKIQVFEMSK